MHITDPAVLACSGLTISVPGRNLVSNLEFDLQQGEMLAILGPNGVGKSLTLHTLAALRAAVHGTVELLGKSVAQLTRSEIARQLALLPQHAEDVFPATVMETALIGRHPHIGRFHWESENDRQIALQSLDDVDLANLSDRDVTTLSGGERRRLAIAQVLAQEPTIYLLDEPTNHLDPQHQLAVLQLFRTRKDDGASIIASLHDVNLAARYADRCLLLFGDGRWELGSTAETLSGENLSRLYATRMEPFRWRDIDLYVASEPN